MVVVFCSFLNFGLFPFPPVVVTLSIGNPVPRFLMNSLQFLGGLLPPCFFAHGAKPF